MTVKEFGELMVCNEPDFRYNGEEYSICCPDGKYYVTASDSPTDVNLKFETIDDMLDHWLIQGRPLCTILPEISI